MSTVSTTSPSGAARSLRRRAATLSGLALVPALVAGALVWGLSDPADDLDRIEAAVVNLDEPVTVDGQVLPLGRQVVAALVAGVGLDGEPLADEGTVPGLTWVLTDAEGAEAGVADGSYAAAVTIPEEFSAAATSLSAEDPEDATTATLDVETSDGGPVGDSAVAGAVGAAVTAALGDELTTTYVDNLYIGFAGIAASLEEAAAGAGELGDGTSQLADGLVQTNDGAEELAAGLDELSAGTSGLAEGTGELAAGADASADGAASLAAGLRQLRDGTSSLPADTRALADGADQVADGTGDLAGSLGALATGLDEAATGAAALPGAARGLADGAAGVDTGAQQVATGTAGVSEAAAAALAGCRQQPGADCAGLEQLAGAAAEVAAGAGELTAGTSALSAGASQLAGSVEPLAAGVRGAADGAAAAAAGAGSLAGGARQVAVGADALADGTPALASGIADAAAGATALAEGSSQLAAGVQDVASGAGQLAEGTGSAAEGADGLAAGTGQLADGAGELATGVDQLATGLTEGAEQVPVYDEEERAQLSGVAADPVTAAADEGTTQERALAYLGALALGIGALVTFLVLRPVPPRVISSRAGSLRLALRSFAPAALVAALQAVLVALVLATRLDLSLGRGAALTGALLVVGLALVAVNQALVVWLGGVGRLVSLAVLAVSVPVALVGTAPELLRAVVAWTPLSAATDALRSVVLADGAGAAVATLAVWTVLSLLLTVLAVRRLRAVDPRRVPAVASGAAG